MGSFVRQNKIGMWVVGWKLTALTVAMVVLHWPLALGMLTHNTATVSALPPTTSSVRMEPPA